MEVVNISSKRLKELEALSLPISVFSAEGDFFKFNYYGKVKVIKRLNKIEGPFFRNKLYTLEALNFNMEYMPNNFVIPEFLVSIDRQIEAFAMKLVSGTNLSLILNDPLTSVDEKKYYLKKIGQILEQMKKIRSYTPLKDFYLGDLHEDNFVINSAQKEMYVVDLDSCKIAGNKSPIAKYLTPKSLLNNIGGKYKIEYEDNCFSNYGVNEDTDIYCYIIIILKYLYNGNINNVDLPEFYSFLNFLNDIGVNLKLLECFDGILSNSRNINPVNYIDSLTSKQINMARTYVKSRK